MPTAPAQSDLHINVPLTNVAVRWLQDPARFVADRIFPGVPVEFQSNVFWKFGKSDWFRQNVQVRAPATEAPKAGWNVATDDYLCKPYSIAHDIDDQRRANTDSFFKTDRDATRFVLNQLRLKRDIDWTDKFFKAGVWSKDWTGVASGEDGSTTFRQFNDATSDPVGFFEDLHINFEELNGFTMNKLVMGRAVLKALKNHPDIIDRIKYTQRATPGVTEGALAELLGVSEIIVPRAIKATGPELNDADADDAAATFSYISNPKYVLGAYCPGTPSIDQPAAGYIFKWRGYVGNNGEGVKVKKFRMEHIESDRVEATMAYDMKVISPDCGVFLADAVA